MNQYIATFHTHFGAVCSLRSFTEAGITASLSPVPRALSAGCGTCLRYAYTEPATEFLNGDFQQVVMLDENGYTLVSQEDIP